MEKIEMESARKIIAEVTDAVSQHSASRKDEVTVMRALINDPEYAVDEYDKTGKCGEYLPGKDFRKMITNVVAATTRISAKEAADLVSGYEFTKADAQTVVNVSKEFVNTYLHTGRKLPLGGRKTSNVELMWKEIADRTAGVPGKDGGDRSSTFIPAHGGIKASNPCPPWVK